MCERFLRAMLLRLYAGRARRLFFEHRPTWRALAVDLYRALLRDNIISARH